MQPKSVSFMRVIAVVTIAAVIVDSLAFARLDPADTVDPEAPPQKITVDLSRRS